MDPRGAGELAEDPSGSCEQLAEEAGLPIPHIQEAREHTRIELERLRDAVARESLPNDMSVCVFGSWARQEFTPGSDHDWAILTRKPHPKDDPAVVAALGIARRHLGGGDREPGKQRIFGCAFDARKLVEKIGLQEDDNHNITRRMLLLLESVGVTGKVRDQAWDEVLTRYLRDIRPDHVPRFLLNDLIRYWRTICVDFEGKHRNSGGEDPKWVERNAKLKTSRKLLFAGGLFPILLCRTKSTEEMRPFLEAWLRARPLDRLAAAFEWAGMHAEGVRALDAYDSWLRIMLDGESRAELRALTESTRHDAPLYTELRDIGERFQRALEALLYESRLAPLSREFLVF